MSDPTHLTLAQARDALRAKTLSSSELAKAHVEAIERAGLLNAFITKTPELAIEAAKKATRDLARRGGTARGPAARHQGSLLHQGRAHDGGEPHPRRFHAHI